MAITRRVVQGQAARSRLELSGEDKLTYAPVGISLGWRPVPDGYRDVATERVVGHGKDALDKVGYALMHWEIHRKAGFFVQPQHESVREGERVAMALPVAPWISVTAICQVVGIVAEGDRTGFAYGTLPTHPQQGEESFILQIHPDESVTLAVRAVSRPAAWFTRLAGPLGRAKQSATVKKFLDAAEYYAAAPPAHQFE